MTWSYVLGHHLLTWWKTSLAITEPKTTSSSEEKLSKNLQGIGANIRIKVYFLHNHLDKFPDNFSDVSVVQGERFF